MYLYTVSYSWLEKLYDWATYAVEKSWPSGVWL